MSTHAARHAVRHGRRTCGPPAARGSRTGCSPRAGPGDRGRGRPRPTRWPSRWRRRSTRPTSRRGRCSSAPPLSAAFMPLVPHASSGRRGVFSQTSQPWYIAGRSRCRSRRGTRTGCARRPGGRTARCAGSAPCPACRPGGPCRRTRTARPVGVVQEAQQALGSDSSRVARLYVAKRRAKPIVRRAGSSTSAPSRCRPEADELVAPVVERRPCLDGVDRGCAHRSASASATRRRPARSSRASTRADTTSGRARRW